MTVFESLGVNARGTLHAKQSFRPSLRKRAIRVIKARRTRQAKGNSLFFSFSP
jgi:hypothetical protein